MPTTTIADRIVAAREAKGMNQAEFAKLLGIKQPTLWQLENGVSKRPRSDTLMAMREAGISPEYIMKNKGPMLLSEFERSAREEALVGSFRRVTPAQQQLVEDMLQQFRRDSGTPGADDPFLTPPLASPSRPPKLTKLRNPSQQAAFGRLFLCIPFVGTPYLLGLPIDT